MSTVSSKQSVGFHLHKLRAATTSRTLLHDVSFQLQPGQMLCVIGGSDAGKSLLLRALSGRPPRGCRIERSMSPAGIRAGFVPTEDILIGELTIRETLRYSARLHLPHEAAEAREQRIDALINAFGLSHVADNIVGTALRRGLSGGEKRRVSVMVECIAAPELLLLDEPTSGLDSSSALAVLQAIKQTAESNRSCVVASLQQPNTRLLELFAQVMILHRGQVVYLGPSINIAPHFASLGYALPALGAPTDHVAELLNVREEAVTKCVASLQQQQQQQQSSGANDHSLHAPNKAAPSHAGNNMSDILVHTKVLMDRFTTMAVRTAELYWLQFILIVNFGFLIGAVFWQLPFVVDERVSNLPNGLTWLTYAVSYIQIFRVFYLTAARDRFQHESANGTYGIVPWAVADLTVTAFFTFIAFIPGLLVTMFMMGVPFDAIGFCVFLLWVAALAAESLVDLLVQLVQSTPYAVLLCQLVLVLTSVFAGGAFITFDRVDHNFWVWLQDISTYNFSSRAIELYVMARIEYACPTAVGDQCVAASYTMPCTATTLNGSCTVTGSNVLAATRGLSPSNPWIDAGVLIGLLFAFRFCTALIQSLQPQQYIQQLWLARTQAVVGGSTTSTELIATAKAGQHADVAVDVPRRQLSHVKDSLLTWQDVKLSLRTNDTVLVSDMTGYASSGQVLAILGGSGAGKTTFLNALAYRAPYANISGQVLLNGKKLTRSDLVYVPQFDTLNPSMTCMQSLQYNDALYSVKPNPERTTQLLDLLDMSHRAKTLVGELTFGERKRLAVGMALLTDAPVLLLDEPTTGLDSYNAKVLVEYVRKLVRESNTVCIMTIHQPGSQLMTNFDSLLLLKSGRTAFFGPADQIDTYFGMHGQHVPKGVNPADFYLDVTAAPPGNSSANGEKPSANVPIENDWCDLYIQHRHLIADNSPPDNAASQTNGSRQMPGELRRFLFLVGSLTRYFITERSLYLLRGLQMLVLALFIGSLYFQLSLTVSSIPTIGGALFFNTWSVVFAAISGIVIHARERVTTENEYLNGAYTLATVHAATLVASVPFHLVTGLLYNAILWFMVGLHNTGDAYIYAALSSTVLLIMMEGVAMMLVALLKDAMLSTTCSMLTLGTFYLFAGFFIQQADQVRSVFWVDWLMPTHYSLDGQFDNIFQGQVYSDGPGGASVPGEQLLAQYFNLTHGLDTSKWGNLGIVIVFMLAFRFSHWMVTALQYRKYAA